MSGGSQHTHSSLKDLSSSVSLLLKCILVSASAPLGGVHRKSKIKDTFRAPPQPNWLSSSYTSHVNAHCLHLKLGCKTITSGDPVMVNSVVKHRHSRGPRGCSSFRENICQQRLPDPTMVCANGGQPVAIPIWPLQLGGPKAPQLGTAADPGGSQELIRARGGGGRCPGE